MIAYKASPLHSSVRLGEASGNSSGDPKKSKVKSLFISPTNKPKETKQEPPSRSQSVNGQDVTQPTYYIDQFNKIPVQDVPTRAINEQVTNYAKNNPNLTPNTQAQNLYPSVQDETTQTPKNPILTGEKKAGEVNGLSFDQSNQLFADKTLELLKDNLFMTGALKQPIDTYMSGREDFFKGDTSRGFQKGVMSLAELTSIPFTALDQITRQIPDVGNDIADISTAPFVVLGEAGKDINKSIREFLGIKLQDPEQEKLADELAGVFMQFAVPMVGGKLMGLTKTGLKKLTEVKGVIETIPEPLRTPENVQKLLTEGTKFENIVDPQGNVTRIEKPTGDFTSTPENQIQKSKENISQNPNMPIDLPKIDQFAGINDIGTIENVNLTKGLEPSKKQQFKEQVQPQLDEWLKDSKNPEDFINRIQREYYVGGTKKGEIISKMLVDYGYVRDGALPNKPFNAYDEYYRAFKKEDFKNEKISNILDTEITDADKKLAQDFVDIKRHGNLNLNSVDGGVRLEPQKTKKGLNDIKKGNFETEEAKKITHNIKKAYENGIKGNNERGDFSNSYMSAEELKAITYGDKPVTEKPIEKPKEEVNFADELSKRRENLDKEKVYTDLKSLQSGDYVGLGATNRRGAYEGFVKKVNPKNIIIETSYMGKPMELSFPKNEVTKFYKPKTEVKSVEIPKTEINSTTEPIKFKDTGEAIKFGKTATEEQVKQLEKQKTELDAEIEKGFSDPTYDKIKHRQNIAQYQYLDESIQTAKGINKDILKSLEKPKNPKFKNPDTRDLYEEIKDYSDIDSKGNVTVYHRTNDASPILKTGKFKALEDGIFFSTKENGQAIGYGKEVVKLKIPLDKLALDDVFKDEAHLRIDLGRNREIDLSKYIDKKYAYQDNIKTIKDAISKKSLDMSGLSKLVDMTDKKVLKATYEIAKYHFENGIQKFGDWARQMVKDAGDWIKPHLKRLWSEVKAYATGDKAMLDPNTLGLFGGGSAKEFNLAKEQGRLFEGKYDKKTRFEIDDSKAKLKVDFHEAWGEGQTKFKLGDVLDHPELFKNYPEFKDIEVKVTTGTEYQGSYSPKDNTIRISLNNTDGNKSTLLHELQHGIQEVENFARGGNTNTETIMPDLVKRRVELNKILNEMSRTGEYGTNEYLKLKKERDAIIDKEFEIENPNTPEKGYNAYKNLAGEIEARDVQARMDYTAEQRKQIPPYSSENISPNDAIINYETGQSNLINKKGTRKVDPDRIQQGEKQSEFTPNEKTIHGDIRKEIKDIMNKDLDLMRELRRGQVTDAQVLKKAIEIGVKIATEGDKFFDRIKAGDVFPIEEHLAIVAYATKRVKDVLADKTATPTQKFDVMTMFYKAEAISGELGRSLRGRQLIERLPIDDIKGLGKDILDAPDIPQEHKDAVSGMLDDMQKRPNLIHQPNWYDKLRYVFYNAMLSRPLTHLRNIAGNTFHLAYEYALNPVSPVKALRNAEFKKTLAKVWKEGGDVSKFTEGMYEPKNPLVRNAMPTSWLKFEDIVFKELAKGIQKTREAKSIMKDFGGDYDVVIKAINNVMEGKTIGNEKINTRLQKAVDGIEEYAKYVTFQKDLGNVGTKFQSWLKSIKGSELIVPFVRTPANILKVGLQPLKVLKYLTKEQRAKFNEMTPVEKRMEITRITAGAVAYTVLYQLASNNVIDITGQGAEDKSKRDFMEKQGWKPNSIKIGDRYYSYQNIQPFNVGLGIVGNYLDGIKYNSKPKDNELEWYQKWSKTLAGFVATTTDQSFLSGLSELAKWQQTKNPYYLEGFVNSFIPGILSVGKDFTTDTNAYDTKTVGEKLKGRTGLTDGLRPRINVFGEPEKTQGTGLPFTVIPPKLGEQETPDEMSKLFLDNNVTISYPKKDIVKADGQKVSDEEYYDFVKESGQRIKKKLDENFELLKTMDSGTMNDEIDRVVNDIRNTVKDEMFGKKERTKKQYKIKL